MTSTDSPLRALIEALDEANRRLDVVLESLDRVECVESPDGRGSVLTARGDDA